MVEKIITDEQYIADLKRQRDEIDKKIKAFEEKDEKLIPLKDFQGNLMDIR